jgi:hypothetical protein
MNREKRSLLVIEDMGRQYSDLKMAGNMQVCIIGEFLIIFLKNCLINLSVEFI